MGASGIAVLTFFSSGISVVLILTCSIAVSFSPAACGFSSFWLAVFGKRRSFMVLGTVHCALLSNARQYFLRLKTNGKWLHNFWQLIYDEIGRGSFSIIVPINSRSSHVSSQWLRLIFGVYMLEINKHVSVTDYECGIGISWIFDTVFRYLPIFLTVLRYWVPPQCPPQSRVESKGN